MKCNAGPGLALVVIKRRQSQDCNGCRQGWAASGGPRVTQKRGRRPLVLPGIPPRRAPKVGRSHPGARTLAHAPPARGKPLCDPHHRHRHDAVALR